MASVSWRTAHLSSRFARRWASAAAAVPLTQATDYHDPNLLASIPSRRPTEEVKITKLTNDLTVASLENNSPYCDVAVLVSAGSSVESYEQRGITHLMRNTAFLSTKEKSTFVQLREVDYLGGSLSANSTRDHLIYSAKFMRGNLDQVMDNLGGAVCSPAFKEWEIADQTERIKSETSIALAQPRTVVMEGLYKAAFQGGLSNPINCPQYNAGKFTGSDLRAHYDQWFRTKNMTVVGVGVDHSELVEQCESRLSSLSAGVTPTIPPSEYVGGREMFLDSGSPLAHVAVVSKGPSYLGNIDDLLAAGVLQHVLGSGPFLKWGSNTASARLNKAVAGSVQDAFTVNALNVSHANNGLFGFYAISHGKNMGQVLRTAMLEFSKVSQGDISSDDLSRAKNQLKAEYLMYQESQSSLLEDIGLQASLFGAYTPLTDCAAMIDKITAENVASYAKMLFGTKATLVAHGNLVSVPRLDQLLSGVKLK